MTAAITGEPSLDPMIARIKTEINKVSGPILLNFEKIVAEIQKVVGSRPKIQAAIQAWQALPTPLNDAGAMLQTVAQNAKSYWSGAAGQGFIQYTTDAKTTVDTWRNTVTGNGIANGAIIAGLNAASTQVINIITGLVKALTTLLNGVLAAIQKAADGVTIPVVPAEAGGGGGGGLSLGSAIGPITALLTTFNETFETLVTTAATALAGFDSAGNDVRGGGAGLPPLTAPSDAVLQQGLGTPPQPTFSK